MTLYVPITTAVCVDLRLAKFSVDVMEAWLGEQDGRDAVLSPS